MGTPLAVSAAVIYMARLEDPLLTTNGLLFYRGFIDDIFFIWSGNLPRLHSFLNQFYNLASYLSNSLGIAGPAEAHFLWTGQV